MRPYKIAATEKILSRIAISTNYKKTGNLDAGGYIWHTTGERVIIVTGCINALESRVSGTLVNMVHAFLRVIRYNCCKQCVRNRESVI